MGEDQASFSKRPCASMRLRLSIGQLGFGSLSKTHGLLHETGLAPEHAPDPSEHEASILAEKRHVFHFIAVYFNIFQWFLHLVSSFSFRQNFPLVLVFALAWFGLQTFVVSLRLLARHLVCFGATTEDPPSPTNVLHV